MELSEHRESLEEVQESSPASAEQGDSRAEPDEALRALEVARGRERHLEQQIERLEQRLLDVETDLAAAKLQSRRAHDLVDELHGTLSWRITAPLRAVSHLLRRG